MILSLDHVTYHNDFLAWVEEVADFSIGIWISFEFLAHWAWL